MMSIKINFLFLPVAFSFLNFLKYKNDLIENLVSETQRKVREFFVEKSGHPANIKLRFQYLMIITNSIECRLEKCACSISEINEYGLNWNSRAKMLSVSG